MGPPRGASVGTARTSLSLSLACRASRHQLDWRRRPLVHIGSATMGRATVDGPAVERLIAREIETYQARTPACRQLLERARRVLPLGVPSTFQEPPPYPLYVRSGKGSHVWDVDGNEYLDFHLGFGSLAPGPAPPRLGG